MSNPRREKQRMVKKKISQILLSVREEKQHIENQLARNDLRIKQYCEEYEKLRQETDLTHLTKNETIILLTIMEGLRQAHIDPLQILGQQASELIKKSGQDFEVGHRSPLNHLNTQEVIKLQENIINDLLSQIKAVEDSQKKNQTN